MAASSIPGYQLPAEPENGGRQAQGFVTPTVDRLPQKAPVLPRRVLPIVFLPGIMGSNLRLSAGRQRELGKDNNIAWRPDRANEAAEFIVASTAERQLQLDPNATEIDSYSPNAPTGDPNETPEKRGDNVAMGFMLPLDVSSDAPLLMDDPFSVKSRKTKEQKARERGWGEVFFGSYGELLRCCESRLYSAFRGGRLDPWWKSIVDVDPAAWQAAPGAKLPPLTEKELRQALSDCWFPVHAMGYNWLKSNRQSGIDVAKRINQTIAQYRKWGFQCEKVIVVTHSMGGLVARALIHPDMGNLQDKVLGMVHGVMPAIGAAAAYKRMRCGFEDGGLNVPAKVIGNFGDEVTAVLGNSQGGLELLPSRAYGNGWLFVVRKGEKLVSLPSMGDPYKEIYKLQTPWYRLLNEAWLNPANLKTSGLGFTHALLTSAGEFHDEIINTYHLNSYAHYGVDPQHAAWSRVVWSVGAEVEISASVDAWQIAADSRQGALRAFDSSRKKPAGMPMPWVSIHMLPPTDPGDQTVPAHSANHQLGSKKFKGIFCQTGYEHQESYKNEAVLRSTLYSLVKIIETMDWSK